MNAQRITTKAATTSNFENDLFDLFLEEETVTHNDCGSYPTFDLSDIEIEIDLSDIEEELEFGEPEWLEPNIEIEIDLSDIEEELEFGEFELSFFNSFTNSFTKEEQSWFDSEPQEKWDICDHDILVQGPVRGTSDQVIVIGMTF